MSNFFTLFDEYVHVYYEIWSLFKCKFLFTFQNLFVFFARLTDSFLFHSLWKVSVTTATNKTHQLLRSSISFLPFVWCIPWTRPFAGPVVVAYSLNDTIRPFVLIDRTGSHDFTFLYLNCVALMFCPIFRWVFIEIDPSIDFLTI